jgi:hypothetical protein
MMLLELEPEKDEIRRANRHKPLVANTCTSVGISLSEMRVRR